MTGNPVVVWQVGIPVRVTLWIQDVGLDLASWGQYCRIRSTFDVYIHTQTRFHAYL